MYGQLLPLGGGDPIPLLKKLLLVGRRESCDVVLRFSNVSAHHCQLYVNQGYWFVKDLGSRNGTKVNGTRVTEKRIDPGDTLSVAKHKPEFKYSPSDLGPSGPPPSDDLPDEIMGTSLLDRAGLNRRKYREQVSLDAFDDEPRQVKDPNKPV
jgi:adenylate cyclase